MAYTDKERFDDYHWFLDNYDAFFREYGHKFFVIQNKEIIGIFDDKDEAVDAAIKNQGLGKFIVQECNGDESGYTNYLGLW